MKTKIAVIASLLCALSSQMSHAEGFYAAAKAGLMMAVGWL